MLRNQPWDAVLSISGSHDVLSAIDPALLADVPHNVRLNCFSSNFEILEGSCLYIGQGGQGGTLEAIYCGVPQIIIPPTPHHYSVGRRVSDLGLGDCLPISGLSQDNLLRNVAALLNNSDTLERVQAAANLMRNQRGAEIAVDSIEECLSGNH
jgi:UDP:flavonoid glycosyltransferase YjiC (YdhE family)